MQRHAFAMKIKEGQFHAFRVLTGTLWNDVTGLLDSLEAHNFSLWNIDDLVFGYYETAQKLVCSGEQKQRYRVIAAQVGKLADWISAPDQEMRLMYEDFGIVRDNKELIRHRVFATQLRGDYQEEYKARHDALAEARGQVPDPGPDSNFSIWNAGRYIFGYDEIDVTMEEAETEESRAATIAWETKMLEIMEWFTDDVDWITGLRHHHIQRIGYHN